MAASTFTVPTAPTAVTAPTLKPTMYDQNYYNQIMSNYTNQANTALTSPAAKQTAATNRENLAGSGVLSGDAYDVSQAGWAENLQNEYTQAGLQDVNNAQSAEAQYEANLPSQQFSLNEQAQTGNLAAQGQYEGQLQNLATTYATLAQSNPEAADYYAQILNAMGGTSGDTSGITGSSIYSSNQASKQLAALAPLVQSGKANTAQIAQYNSLMQSTTGSSDTSASYAPHTLIAPPTETKADLESSVSGLVKNGQGDINYEGSNVDKIKTGVTSWAKKNYGDYLSDADISAIISNVPTGGNADDVMTNMYENLMSAAQQNYRSQTASGNFTAVGGQ